MLSIETAKLQQHYQSKMRDDLILESSKLNKHAHGMFLNDYARAKKI